MERIRDGFLPRLESAVPLTGLTILEIGCGDGTRSATIAERCGFLIGIEPDKQSVEQARAKGIKNALFRQGRAHALPYEGRAFDAVLFTLSFHHIPLAEMWRALDEAARVTKPRGHVILLEPGMQGTLFDAEIRFGAGDGDERREKQEARTAILTHRELDPMAILWDDTALRFDGVEDFRASLSPTKNEGELPEFLRTHNNVLWAERLIYICQVT